VLSGTLTADSAAKLIPKIGNRSAYDRGAHGWALYQIGRFREAVVYLDSALQLAPEEPKLSLLRVYVFRKLKERDSVKLALQQTLALDPKDTFALTLRALTTAEQALEQEESGQVAPALANWREASVYYERAKDVLRSKTSPMWNAVVNWDSWAQAHVASLTDQMRVRKTRMTIMWVVVAVIGWAVVLVFIAIYGLVRTPRKQPEHPQEKLHQRPPRML